MKGTPANTDGVTVTPDRATPREADFNDAPRLVDGARELQLSASHCNLEYWIEAVAQGTLSGLTKGHPPESKVPDFMREPGPLRSALIEELAFRSMTEETATRALGYAVILSPDIETLEFFTTQLVDEARHARVFRDHLVELGVPADKVLEVREEVAGQDRDEILEPLEAFALPIGRDDEDFIGGVAVLTVLAEGLLAPLAELSELKWRPLDPAAADIERGANIDEIRHLTVGSSVVREHLLGHPEDRPRLVELLRRGRRLFAESPIAGLMLRRELMYQEGLEQHAEVVGDYEITEGRRLLDTTPEIRLQMALDWTTEMQDDRLTYMGLEEAITF